MRYTRTLEIECEGCGGAHVVRDGDTLPRYFRGERSEFVAGETSQPVPLTSAVLHVLERGWVAMTPIGIDGRFETFRQEAPLESTPRGLTVVCPECVGKVTPPLSQAAQRALSEAEAAEQSLPERVARLEAVVAVLSGMREAVSS